MLGNEEPLLRKVSFHSCLPRNYLLITIALTLFSPCALTISRKLCSCPVSPPNVANYPPKFSNGLVYYNILAQSSPCITILSVPWFGFHLSQSGVMLNTWPSEEGETSIARVVKAFASVMGWICYEQFSSLCVFVPVFPVSS